MLLLVHELEIQKKKLKEKNLRNNTEYKGYDMWKTVKFYKTLTLKLKNV